MDNLDIIFKKLKLYSIIWKPKNIFDFNKACHYIYTIGNVYEIRINKKYKKYDNLDNFQCINIWCKKDKLSLDISLIKSDMHQLFIAPNNNGFLEYIDTNISISQYYIDTNIEFDESHFNICYKKCYNKGMISRAIFYTATIYYKRLLHTNSWFLKNIPILKKWNQLYPPTNFEISRNYRIKKLQGNVNPYIINPTLIDVVFK